MAFLLVRSGALAGQKIEIQKNEVSLGRAAESDLTVADPSVSAKHCCILRDGRKYTLRDLRSTNGTRLNGEPVTESRLKPNDVISIGSADIVFDGTDVDVDASPAGAAADTGARTILQAARPPTTRQPSARDDALFTTRKDRRWMWRAAIALMAVVALVALAWFLMNLKGS